MDANTCNTCKQAVRPNQESLIFSRGRISHAIIADCVKATARRCAEIAEDRGTSMYATVIGRMIRREFDLEPE